MKVEKINDNKMRITLTFDELEKRKISLQDIERDASVAKELFIDLIEETALYEDFAIEDSQLFIEASSDNNNLFIVTITKVDDIPELKKYSLMENAHKSSKSQNKKISSKSSNYKIDSNIYIFSSINNILKLCETAKKENIFFGKNSLYKYKENYYIVFSQNSVKNAKFLKTFVFLSEYCDEYYSYDLFSASIKEKSKLIIENNALQKLSKI